ncbi:MAG: M1 family metallopeptidase [Christensenellales bacterium]|jgi:hypothetical protein
MKKFAFVLLLCTVLLLFVACKDTTPPPPENISRYYLEIKLNEDEKQADVSQRIEYVNSSPDTLSELYLHLYANNYRESALNAAFDSPPARYGGIDILSFQIEGKDTPFCYLHDSALIKVNLPTPLPPKGKVSLTIKYTLDIPQAPLRFGTFDRSVNLGNFYPVMAVYEKGEWRLDSYTRIGDPFYSEVADYKVDVICLRSYVVASSGSIMGEEYDNRYKTVRLEQKSVRDFALFLSKDYLVKSKNVLNTTVNYYYYLDTDPEESLNTAARALEIFSGLFGEYPYPEYNVAEAAFFHGGMEYPALSVINATKQDKQDVIIHETAHQWFSCLIGTDSIREAYIDEGLATFCTLLYYKLNGDEERYAHELKNLRNAYVGFTMIEQAINPSYEAKMTKTLYEYKSMYEYEIICYSKSAIMFSALYEAMGEEAFFKGMKRFYVNNCYRLSCFEQLMSALSSKRFDSGKIMFPFINGDVVITTLAV